MKEYTPKQKKTLMIIGAVLAFFALFAIIDKKPEEKITTSDYVEKVSDKPDYVADTVKPINYSKAIILDLLKIVNKTEKEIEPILGKASKKEKVKGYPCENTNCYRVYYNSKNIEIIFKEGKVNRITINETPDFTSNENALETLGLQNEKPTFKNPTSVIRWVGVQGFAEINCFPDYILIDVSKELN